MDKFKEFLSKLESLLRDKKFKKKGNIFYKIQNGNYGFLEFQKSVNSSLVRTLFTINIKITIPDINSFFKDEITINNLLQNFHWAKRIGFFLKNSEDHWYEINSDKDINELAQEIFNTLDRYVLPILNFYLEPENLIHQWLLGIGEGITEFQIMLYLIVIMKLRKDERLPFLIKNTLARIEGKSYEVALKLHFKELKLDNE